MKKKQYRNFLCFLAPSFLGVCIFTLQPFMDVVRRSFLTVMSESYTGLDNYINVVTNPAFRLAVYNTLHFVVVAIPILVVSGLAVAWILSKINDNSVIKSLYLFPMAMPTATVVIVWRMFFYRQDFESLVASFLWKNLGYTIVLWLAGIAGIPKELEEAAKVDGAGNVKCFFYVKLPCLRGSLYTIVVLCFLNSFKIYREAYLVAGAYPKQEIYLLQHIFSNWYVNLELDKLSAATVMVGAVLMAAIFIWNHLWNGD